MTRRWLGSTHGGVRVIVIVSILVLVVTACGSDSEPTSVPPDSTTSLLSGGDSTETTGPVLPNTIAPVVTTTVPEVPIAFSTAAHGAGVIGSLSGSGGMLGSGCVPGSDRLPDGIWFGWPVQAQTSHLVFDLACLLPGDPPTATNTSQKLRDVGLADDAAVQLVDGSTMPATEWIVGDDPIWLFVNAGLATEIAYPTIEIAVEEPSSGWVTNDGALPVTGGCCATMYQGPRSPTDPWPATGMPADGIYDLQATTDVAAGDLVLTIRRFVPCAERPDLCHPDYIEGDLGVDYDEAIVCRVAFDGDLTARLIGVRPTSDSPIVAAAGIEGSGRSLLALIKARDAAYAAWIQPQLDAGADINAIYDDLLARGDADSDFPYGSSDGYGVDAGPLAYRGPHNVLLVEWLSGPTDLLTWATQLEVSNGQPIIYVNAGQIAG